MDSNVQDSSKIIAKIVEFSNQENDLDRFSEFKRIIS